MTNIRITGVNENLLERVEGTIFDVYLDLSETPPSGWSRRFAEAWRSALYSMKRNARVEGNRIVVRCPPDEIATDHRSHLIEAVAEANRRYAADLRHVEAAELRDHKEDTALRQTAIESLSGLVWDDD